MAVMAQFSQYSQPVTKAVFSPKNSRAYDTKEPELGRCSTNSPSARRMRKAKKPQIA